MNTPALTHIFTALYRDGETFRQPDDDAPATPREDGGGSAFADVDVSRVRAFYLESEDHVYSVNLDDGHFEIDHTPFHLGGPDVEGPLSLVYFRRVHQDKTTRIATGAVTHSVRRCYHLGWRDARGVERTIEVGHEVFTE